MSKFTEYLKGKRVVMVGPAPTIVGKGQGPLIDDYDIVVRINKAIPLPDDMQGDIGSRTDVLYNCLHHLSMDYKVYTKDFLLNSGIEWMICPYPNISPFARDIRKYLSVMDGSGLPFRCFGAKRFNEISEEMKTRPNSGICAAVDLLDHDIKELYMTGFTFLRGGYYKEYRDIPLDKLKVQEENGTHSQPPQIEFMKRVLDSDSRLVCDDEMLEVLRGE